MLYLLLNVQMQSFASRVCVCVWERERERDGHHSGVYSQSEIVLIAACLQTHTSIITVCHTTLFPLGLELRAIASGVKGGDDYRGPRQGGGQLTGRGQPKKMHRTVDGPLLRVVTKANHWHVFLSLANLNIQKILKHSNIRRGKALSIRPRLPPEYI